MKRVKLDEENERHRAERKKVAQEEEMKRLQVLVEEKIGEVQSITKRKKDLSVLLYDTLDRYVRDLDVTIKRYDTEIRKGVMECEEEPHDFRTHPWPRGDTEYNEMVETLFLVKSMRDYAATSRGGGVPGANGGSNTSSTGFDIPVDPSEPVYCTCRKVQFGNMICCDNTSCRIEWFHFSCVGLDSQPRGKWYCEECKETLPLSVLSPTSKKRRKKRKSLY